MIWIYFIIYFNNILSLNTLCIRLLPFVQLKKKKIEEIKLKEKNERKENEKKNIFFDIAWLQRK